MAGNQSPFQNFRFIAGERGAVVCFFFVQDFNFKLPFCNFQCSRDLLNYVIVRALPVFFVENGEFKVIFGLTRGAHFRLVLNRNLFSFRKLPGNDFEMPVIQRRSVIFFRRASGLDFQLAREYFQNPFREFDLVIGRDVIIRSVKNRNFHGVVFASRINDCFLQNRN